MSDPDLWEAFLAGTGWHDRAACNPRTHPGLPADLFVPPALTGKDGDKTLWNRTCKVRAMEICRGCPVVGECGDWARRHAIPVGVWGGQCRGTTIYSKGKR